MTITPMVMQQEVCFTDNSYMYMYMYIRGLEL